VLTALSAKREILADPSQDIWALGVVAYECLTHSAAFPVFCTREDIDAAAQGTCPYPWEADKRSMLFVKSKARPLIEACLSRSAARRPTAQQLLARIDALGFNATKDCMTGPVNTHG
jgi:serine/threonine protein kinase